MPAARRAFRAFSFSLLPLRRAGLSITRTLTPRWWAAITAWSSVGSVNRNILMFNARLAALIGSRIALTVSSGRTISVLDIVLLRAEASIVSRAKLDWQAKHRLFRIECDGVRRIRPRA